MEQLGIEPQLLLAQIVNFLIIIIVLQKLLFKPILGMIEKRKKEIAEGLALTQRMQQEEEKLVQKREEVLMAARQDGGKLIDDAKKQAKDAEKEIIAGAHVQASEIIKRAKDEADRIQNQAQKDIRIAAIDLAKTLTKQLLSSILSAKEQHRLIAENIKDLEKIADKNV